MAIYHCSMKPVSRSTGRSAVAASAYRSATQMTNERDGITHDFTRKQGVEHAEIVLPDGSDAEWARDRSALWNAAEKAEVRKDARVAREFEIALPHELTAEQRLALTRDFARDLANRHGAAVDFALHRPHEASDVRNHHAHLMMTTRMVGPEGLGDKTDIERENKWLLTNDRPTSQMQLRDIRQAWEHHANAHLARAGLDMRIDHRSHEEQGLEIEPTQHVGIHATQMNRRGLEVNRARLDEDAARRNAELIREKPEQVLTLITNEKSVFDRHDVARSLHRYIDDSKAFRNAFASVMASPALVELQAERPAGPGGAELARYSTREMFEIETGMAVAAERMHKSRSYRVEQAHIDRALANHDAAIRSSVATSTIAKVNRGELSQAEGEHQISTTGLSDEQRRAVEHITGPERVTAVVGFAGAGKSTMLAAAREAWQAQGYRVRGAALAGKAAEGLEESSGIESRTLASWDYGWRNGRGTLGRGDVLVIDEAGMVGSRQLGRFVAEAEARGAKIALVGDHEQLQAIGAGAPFRAIAERIGFAELQSIRRQREGWQREASVAFASHRTAEGLRAYDERGGVTFSDSHASARGEIVRDYLADRDERPEGTRVAMAHRRVDVRAINAEIRTALQDRGALARGEEGHGPLGRELIFQTHDGKRGFAPGDRIVFLENNRELGVKNGMLGSVEAVEAGRITARLDGKGRSVSVSTADYRALDHGYATTIHKTQGATVDRSFVLASATMDRHLTYVAMTRHRDGVQLYAGRDEFKSKEALSARLGRAGRKETTLDYARSFGERRGVAGHLGIDSRIEVPRDRQDRAADRRQQGPGAENTATPLPRRGLFAGLKLNAGDRDAASDRPRPAKREAARDPQDDRLRSPSGFERAVDRYARAYGTAERMARDNLPVLDSQKMELREAGRQLDQARPGSVNVMRSALQHDREMRRVLMDLSGRERTARLISGLERERQLQADPNVRAERLMHRWRTLDAQRKELRGWRHDAARGRVEGQMREVAGAIERDPPVASIVRDRAKELGIERITRDQPIAGAMKKHLTRGRGMGFSR